MQFFCLKNLKKYTMLFFSIIATWLLVFGCGIGIHACNAHVSNNKLEG